MNKLVFKNQKYYFVCDFAHREIAKKAGFKWCAANKLWFTEDKFKALLLYNQHHPEITQEIYDQINTLSNYHYESNNGFLLGNIWEPATEDLKEFQQCAVKHMAKKPQNWLLADEQGLGKTIQTIAVINESKNKTPTVVIICPATVKLNWKKEAIQWLTKEANIQILEGNTAKPHFEKGLANIFILNYQILSIGNLAILRLLQPDLLILDEAHYLKNRESERTKKVLLAKDALVKFCKQTIALTGTPVTKHPVDIWPLATALCPESIAPYKSYWDFAKHFCKLRTTVFGWEIEGSKNEEELGLRLRSTFMIRRTKEEVLPQLPAKQFQIVTLAKNKVTGAIIQKEKSLPQDEFDMAIKKQEMKPVGHIATLRKELGEAKLPQCVEFIKDELESVDKVVIFAWHIGVITDLEESLASFNPVVVSGYTKNSDRQKNVEKFQTDETCRVFIGNILAAGTAITLTAASRVIFVESSWLASDIEQAMDRCHRIGQLNHVLAQFLVVEDSIDAKVLETVVSRMKNTNKILKIL